MPRLCLIIVSVMLLAACTQAAQPVATTPALTSTPRSLTQVDLEALVIQPGDLPPMDARPEKISPSPFFAGSRPGIATSFARLLQQGEYVLGSIYVDVYTDTVDAKKAYEGDVALFQDGEQLGYTLVTPAVGDQAMLQYRAKDDGAIIAILRCHARIWISFPASKDATLAKDTILAYAQRLDARLKPLVCT